MDFPHFLYSACGISCLASEQVASETECCSYYVDFFSVAAVEAALVIMQCTAADLKDDADDDRRVGYAVKCVVITGVIELIDSAPIIVDDEWCGIGRDKLLRIMISASQYVHILIINLIDQSILVINPS